MKTPHEPLTPEERELAAQLSKLGPHGGPSPQLDARILSAARTAVQGRSMPSVRRPRWPLGLGVAASVLLAVGVAWQLRPLQEMPVASEVPVEAMSAPAAAEAEAAAIADVAAPTEPDDRAIQAPLPSDAPEAPPGPLKPSSDPARQNAEAAARKEEAPRRSPLSVIPSVPGLPLPADAPAPAARTPQAFPKAARPQDGLAAPEAPPPAPAPVAEAAPREDAAVQFRALESRRREQDRRAAAAQEGAESRTLDSISVSGSRVRPRQADTFGYSTPAPAAPPPPAPAASAGSSAEPGAARAALRRTDLQVPVDEDTKLPEDEWLDRIRLRRDLGDAANATRSLQLFVQEHPFQRVPDDLRPLLGEP